jgi:type IV pilus assembly protein PilX
MNTLPISHNERGAILVVSMLFLLVVTIIAVVAARNSTFSTKMSSNMQDSYSSFQSAEAGVLAALMLSRTANDPFDGNHEDAPFAAYTEENHPLRELNDEPAATTVEVLFTGNALSCPRAVAGFSEGLLDCDYYRVESEHEVEQRARTRVDLGVVKTLIGSASR